ncbi:DUF1990 family protein [Actinacidiphila yeochonensis]|uniref:DUF1990 family protein n=1 Tax=Actinacidiphila yeochonensis TaxID=89050 RepID=UPI00056A62B1|nr:DUF1990 domain-containing protein [Actinacidiphila yeochonensis]
MADLTYPFAGVTSDEALRVPDGFRALRVRTVLAPGAFEPAADALFAWRMHQGVPLLRMSAEQPRAVPGVRVVLRLGPLAAPCRVVWAVREGGRAGFGYGTLPGHPECGEESFVLRRDPAGPVTFTVLAVSRPAAWYARAAGPVGRRVRRGIALLYARSLAAAIRTP